MMFARLFRPLFLIGIGSALAACGRAAPPPEPPAPAQPATTASAEPIPEPAAPAAEQPETCGALDCQLFDTPAEAFAKVFEHDPLVVAVGESHAKLGTEGIPSSATRFTRELLPLFEGKASDLVLELWVADGSCGKLERAVEKEQKPVTANQRATNQNEFVVLGNRSNELGIRPHVLRPTCEEYTKSLAAGPDGIQRMLAMIAEMTDTMLRAIHARNVEQGRAEQIAIAYGGAMHNDIDPKPGREPFSFGPQQVAYTDGRYVEIDLIVPEFIGDSDVWQALPWYEHFDPDAHPDRVTLYEVQPKSYVLIFPRTPVAETEAPTG